MDKGLEYSTSRGTILAERGPRNMVPPANYPSGTGKSIVWSGAAYYVPSENRYGDLLPLGNIIPPNEPEKWSSCTSGSIKAGIKSMQKHVSNYTGRKKKSQYFLFAPNPPKRRHSKYATFAILRIKQYKTAFYNTR